MLVCGTANAQLGVYAGYAPNKILTSYDGGTPDTIGLNGFMVGASYNLPVSNGLNVSVGLQYRMNTSTKESQGTLFGVTGYTKQEHNQSLIDIPVLLNYGFDVSNGVKLSILAGPTFSLALSGSTHTVINASGYGTGLTLYDGTANWYDENAKNNTFDISGTLGLCLNFNNILIFGGYNMGLLNLSTADKTVRKANAFFVGAGYAL